MEITGGVGGPVVSQRASPFHSTDRSNSWCRGENPNQSLGSRAGQLYRSDTHRCPLGRDRAYRGPCPRDPRRPPAAMSADAPVPRRGPRLRCSSLASSLPSTPSSHPPHSPKSTPGPARAPSPPARGIHITHFHAGPGAARPRTSGALRRRHPDGVPARSASIGDGPVAE